MKLQLAFVRRLPPHRRLSPPVRLLLTAIRGYQRTISPDHGLLRGAIPGGACRFSPTCSEYAAGALQRYGWRGVPLALLRLVRCHPFSPGGNDPVP
ncbi:MAG: membrane protein insertion efficiency factor YidD [Candidatus Andersenbacteria bacterium CG10_big_fil_rev_8_21_14_0_10_54_11]|uniref:Putative membrane protein insertion efficiency factor n=1 Tax=Candidatus Andersenbacteria bacterium CG10_big_fil_rev_8_21_14_0_10_54_11 TaxID=1974485 RepID=A0A2M6X083_9BACT|nr:MAG: membrane protein insertion efficiency factor YidD [Candidatus Andersenbacteria bacterium CG10_big_fil_rev_8_21_14_0_10_54_11]